MSKEIYLPIAGKFNQDALFPDWWNSKEKIECPFFDNKRLAVVITDFVPEEDKNFTEEADAALKNFLNLTCVNRNAISNLAYDECICFLDSVDYDEEESKPYRELKNNVHNIWEFIHPTEIYVKRRHRHDKDIYIKVLCRSDWDPEHGLQLIFRQGKKLTRISDQDGHLTDADAYNKPDEEDILLSNF